MLIPFVLECYAIYEPVWLNENDYDFDDVSFVHASCEESFILVDLLLAF
tara:strand:+ start:1290 stop:1436 length:147 start_codon:yes stop_codon:yes gene_type:complete